MLYFFSKWMPPPELVKLVEFCSFVCLLLLWNGIVLHPECSHLIPSIPGNGSGSKIKSYLRWMDESVSPSFMPLLFIIKNINLIGAHFCQKRKRALGNAWSLFVFLLNSVTAAHITLDWKFTDTLWTENDNTVDWRSFVRFFYFFIHRIEFNINKQYK